MRRFELVEGSSAKFWEIVHEGRDVTVRFGRIGTDGQTQTKSFESIEAAQAHAEKLVREKTRKGYVETAPAEPDPELARLLQLAAEHPSTSRVRVYLLEPDAPRPPHQSAQSDSCVFGDVPEGLLGDDGEGLEHVLTLDLADVPELAPRFPGARAIMLLAVDPEGGQRWDEAELVPVPADLPRSVGGEPLSVVPVDLPTTVFEADDQRDEAARQIADLLINRPGYVLGKPFYVQNELGDQGFVLHLRGHIADLNLGDAGSLYVFDDGSVVFQSC